MWTTLGTAGCSTGPWPTQGWQRHIFRQVCQLFEFWNVSMHFQTAWWTGIPVETLFPDPLHPCILQTSLPTLHCDDEFCQHSLGSPGKGVSVMDCLGQVGLCGGLRENGPKRSGSIRSATMWPCWRKCHSGGGL